MLMFIEHVAQLCRGKQVFTSQDERVQYHSSTLMKKITLLKTEVMVFMGVFFVLVGLAFGFGYFFGRYEQIELNKFGLQTVPDVNCSLVDEP